MEKCRVFEKFPFVIAKNVKPELTCAVEEFKDERGSGREAKDFQDSEPNEDDKECYVSEYKGCVFRSSHHLCFIWHGGVRRYLRWRG